MNFVAGRLVSTDGCGVAFEAHGIELMIPVRSSIRSGLAAVRDGLLGIRPEDLQLEAGRSGLPRHDLAGVVEVVENMGAESYVHVGTDVGAVVCRADSHRRYDVRNTVAVSVMTEKALFFDLSDDSRLC